MPRLPFTCGTIVATPEHAAAFLNDDTILEENIELVLICPLTLWHYEYESSLPEPFTASAANGGFCHVDSLLVEAWLRSVYFE